jgi:hypothetical protein
MIPLSSANEKGEAPLMEYLPLAHPGGAGVADVSVAYGAGRTMDTPLAPL